MKRRNETDQTNEGKRQKTTGGPCTDIVLSMREPAPPTKPPEKRYRLSNVTVGRLLYARDDKNGGGGPNKMAIFTIGYSADEMPLIGFVPKLDFMHRYDLFYVLRPDKKKPQRKVRQIVHIEKVERIPPTCRLLVDSMIKNMELSNPAAISMMKRCCAGQNLQLGAPISLVETVARFGKCKWYQTLEKKCDYFSEWYVDELGTQYTKESLKAIGPEAVSNVMRIAITEPWKLCFWWLSGGDVLLEELPLPGAKALAAKYNGTIPQDIQSLSDAYRHGVFSEARDRGDSFVPIETVVTAIGKAGLDQCVERGIAKVVDGNKVFAAGDKLCEEEVASIIIDIATKRQDDCKLRPEEKIWPECDTSTPAIELNADQRSAVMTALRRRIHVVRGDPGTGKTTYVMRSLVSSFTRGQVVVVAFTGMAAQKLKLVVKNGVTAHRVVDCYKRARACGSKNPYENRTVLVVEEASNVSLRLMLALLRSLEHITRIYLFGDPNQMPPPGGGASLLRSLCERYDQTEFVSCLTMSMRIQDKTGQMSRNLKRICAGNTQGMEWSADPASGHPFVFMRAGRSPAENVKIVRKALTGVGIVDPDDQTDGRNTERWHVMVHTNAYRKAMARAWFESSMFFPRLERMGRQYDDHCFFVGERVMFTKNCNSEHKPSDAHISSDIVTNGTIECIQMILDEDPSAVGVFIEKEYTDEPLAIGWRRWVCTAPRGLRILLNYYGKENIERVPPTTVSKNQGQEADFAVLVIPSENDAASSPGTQLLLGRSGLYTACSRGKYGCIVISDMDPGVEPSQLICPSSSFRRAVASTDMECQHNELKSRFPLFSTIDDVTRIVSQKEAIESDNDEAVDDE